MRYLIFVVLIAVFFMACDEDSSTEPKQSSADFVLTIENVSVEKMYTASGVFNTPVGATAPAPIGPGEAYEFSFDAAPGSRLSFATMFVQSNDLFYAPGTAGIELFNGTMQVTGDVTSQLMLWDAGTEIDQEPGLGADQAPRQSGADTGADDPNNTVRLAADTHGNLPAVSDVIKVVLSSTSATGFKVRVENVSTPSTLMTSDGGSTAVPLAPGVFVVHSGDNPLFVTGQPEGGNGMEELAEDGDPSALHSYLDMDTGITQIIAPGVWVVHSGSDVLFMSGSPDAGEGLEDLAEDGDPSGLASAVALKSGVMSSGVFNTPSGSMTAAPAGPGASYSFTFSAEEGDKLSLATMLVQTNDLFYAPDGMGIELFNNGSAVSGDITGQFMLWDAATEVNEVPGVGLNQAPRQSGADTGTDENGNVRLVNDGFDYPAVNEVIKVTLSIQ